MKIKLRGSIIGVLMAMGLLLLFKEQRDEQGHHGMSVVQAEDGILNVYIDGEDITQQYKIWQQNVKESVAKFLNRDYTAIRFQNFCMLEMDGMTIEAEVESVYFTFLFNIEGEILSVNRLG